MPDVSDPAAPPPRACPLVWVAVALVPVAAWSKDATVLTLAFLVLAVLFQGNARRAVLSVPRPGGLIPAAALVLWSLAAVMWSGAHPVTSWMKTFLVLAMGFVLLRGLPAVPEVHLRKASSIVLVAVLGLLMLLAVERLTDGSFIRLVRTVEMREQLFNVMSAGLAFLNCLAFPVAYLLWRRTGKMLFAGLLILACFLLGLSYRMDAAPIALASGAMWFVLVWRWGKPALVALCGLAAVLSLAWGPLAGGSADAVSGLAASMGPNWSVRLEIWRQVYTLIQSNVLFGYGFDSARTLGQGAVNFLHPHNGILQIWLELGLVGVVLFLFALATGVRTIIRVTADPRTLAAIAGTIGTAIVFFSVSFGLWQGWWLSALVLTAAAAVLVAKDAAHSAG